MPVVVRKTHQLLEHQEGGRREESVQASTNSHRPPRRHYLLDDGEIDDLRRRLKVMDTQCELFGRVRHPSSKNVLQVTLTKAPSRPHQPPQAATAAAAALRSSKRGAHHARQEACTELTNQAKNHSFATSSSSPSKLEGKTKASTPPQMGNQCEEEAQDGATSPPFVPTRSNFTVPKLALKVDAPPTTRAKPPMQSSTTERPGVGKEKTKEQETIEQERKEDETKQEEKELNEEDEEDEEEENKDEGSLRSFWSPKEQLTSRVYQEDYQEYQDLVDRYEECKDLLFRHMDRLISGRVALDKASTSQDDDEVYQKVLGLRHVQQKPLQQQQ